MQEWVLGAPIFNDSGEEEIRKGVWKGATRG